MAWNRYAYVNNNPVKYNDPTGHCLMLCTAIIGGAVGAIVGAVGYTAYAAATGQEFNGNAMLAAAGVGAVTGALIGSGVAFIGGTAAATSFASGAMGAVTNAGISVGADALVTKVATGKSASMGQLAITATASFVTSGVTLGSNSLINGVVSGQEAQAWARLGASALYTPIINTAQRRANRDKTTLMDITMDVAAGIFSSTVSTAFQSDIKPAKLDVISNSAQLPFTNLVPLKKRFGVGDRQLESVILWE